jgi:hypothetical protein
MHLFRLSWFFHETPRNSGFYTHHLLHKRNSQQARLPRGNRWGTFPLSRGFETLSTKLERFGVIMGNGYHVAELSSIEMAPGQLVPLATSDRVA